MSDEDFIEKTQKLHDEVISKAKGFISWEHYIEGNTWTDFVLWESEDDDNVMDVESKEIVQELIKLTIGR